MYFSAQFFTFICLVTIVDNENEKQKRQILFPFSVVTLVIEMGKNEFI